mmetsp:Transcript_15646/g.24960  ORF Transcript_15646/g.24960 Transcript_15646/m.24960 type:complete len:212 (+) Transcript_15646:114-749(+)
MWQVFPASISSSVHDSSRAIRYMTPLCNDGQNKSGRMVYILARLEGCGVRVIGARSWCDVAVQVEDPPARCSRVLGPILAHGHRVLHVVRARAWHHQISSRTSDICTSRGAEATLWRGLEDAIGDRVVCAGSGLRSGPVERGSVAPPGSEHQPLAKGTSLLVRSRPWVCLRQWQSPGAASGTEPNLHCAQEDRVLGVVRSGAGPFVMRVLA